MDPVRALAWAGLLALAAAAYLLAVRAVYRLRSPRPEVAWVPTPDGTRIAVHRRRPEVRRFLEPVLLCHGLAANHVNFDFDPPHSLAHAFAAAGFEVFTVDWRGAGASRARRWWARFLYDADDLIEQDAPALLAHALGQTGAPQAFWVGHSLGALVGYGVLGRAEGARIGGMCALGAPVFFRYTGWVARLSRLALWLAWPLAFRQRWLSIGLAPFLGRVTLPLTEVLLNPRAIAPPVLRKMYCNLVSSMGYRLLRQLADWNAHDAFRSRDGRIDYRARLGQVTTPVLVLGGSQDALATPRAVLAQAELLGSGDKTVMLFGRENGDTLDYGHGDLLFGEHAPVEVYPRILRWVSDRASRLPEPAPSPVSAAG
ncbi:MAG TPA: alpha/beta fold hydrolase [Myxococcaceae bacterium]|nr:alpha/beta fold hydrolase [Myxococcaceae bacterium]